MCGKIAIIFSSSFKAMRFIFNVNKKVISVRLSVSVNVSTNFIVT